LAGQSCTTVSIGLLCRRTGGLVSNLSSTGRLASNGIQRWSNVGLQTGKRTSLLAPHSAPMLTRLSLSPLLARSSAYQLTIGTTLRPQTRLFSSSQAGCQTTSLISALPRFKDNSTGWLGAGLGAAGTAVLFAAGMTAVTSKGQDDGFASIVRERLFYTYGTVAAGLGITAASAASFWRSGIAFRMAPIPFALMSIGASLTSMIALQMTPHENTALRTALFTTFTAAQGLALCPLFTLGGPLLMQAAAATAAVVGSLSVVAASAPSESFLSWSGPLSLGLGIVFACSLGSLFFPGSRPLHNVLMYGGLAVFGGFTLVDTQRVIVAARRSYEFDPIQHSLGIYMNFLQIFFRMAILLSDSKKKK